MCEIESERDHIPEIIPKTPEQDASSMPTTRDPLHKRWACTHCDEYRVQLSSSSWSVFAGPSQTRADFVIQQGRVYDAYGSYDELVEHNITT